MEYYLVPEDRIEVCSENLIVILWDDTNNSRVTPVTDKSTALLSDQTVVEIS